MNKIISKNSGLSAYFPIAYFAMAILLGCISTPIHAAPLPADTVYYTELTCDLKQDKFEMKPGSITREALNTQKPPLLAALKEAQQFAVFLNGKMVGEKVFKDVCKLKDDVTVEVDVDYGREVQSFCREKIPEKYLPLQKYNGFTCIEDTRGNFLIKRSTMLLAAISSDLIRNDKYFNMINRTLKINYYIDANDSPFNQFTPEQIRELSTQQFSVQEMGEKPLLSKGTAVVEY